MEVEKFFVYGTLKLGGYYSKIFDDFRESSMVAKLEKYSLFDLGQFPGIVKQQGGVVFGEVHEYSQQSIVRAEMDRIEGYSGNNSSSLFIREKLPVILDNGTEVIANVYVFNPQLPKSAKVIKTGVWVI